MDSQWKRFWDTGIYPFLEFVLCLSIGYSLALFFFTAHSELRLVDTSDSSFPILQWSLLFAFGFGFGLRKIFPKLPKAAHLAAASFLLAQMFWWVYFGSSEFLINYIFNYRTVFAIGILFSFVLGLFSGSVRDFRFLSLTFGISIFTFYALFDSSQKVSLRSTIFVISILLMIYFTAGMVGSLAFSLRYYKIRSKIGNHPLFGPFYNSGLILLLSYLGLHFYFQPGGRIPIVLTVSLTIVFGRLLSLTSFLKSETKVLYFLGRFIVMLALVLFLAQSYWSYSHILLSILLGILVGYFKPNGNKTSVYVGIFLGVGFLFGFSIVLYEWNSNLLVKSLIAGILSLPILLPFFRQTHILLLPRVLMFIMGFVLSSLAYSQPSIRISTPYAKQEFYDPLPFLLMDQNLANKNFIFYGQTLPFVSESFLPKITDIEGKLVIIGLSQNSNLILSYMERLRKEEHPFFVVVNKNRDSNFSSNGLSLLNRKSYWGFDLYFPTYLSKVPDWNPNLPKDWKFNYFQDRLLGLPAAEVAQALENVIKYSTTELKKDAFVIKQLYYESYSLYALYFFKEGQYRLALKAIELARKFQPPDERLLKTAIECLKLSTPEPEMIPIFQDLTMIPSYREFAWNSLIPMFESLSQYNEALEVMSNLEKLYRIEGKQDLAQEMELARVRLFLNRENFKEAETIISQRSKENPNSVIWERLKSELSEKKESAKRPFQRIEMKEARIQ